MLCQGLGLKRTHSRVAKRKNVGWVLYFALKISASFKFKFWATDTDSLKLDVSVVLGFALASIGT